jgi:thiosulfate dehydrogenase (quinone) large subunit
MNERYVRSMGSLGNRDGWGWAIFFVRWVLGLIFFMAGWWKTFDLGPAEHARKLFVEGFAETWIPLWLLWALGTAIPVVELAAGGLMCLGLRVREAGIALGVILILVAYGHLLKEPLFDTTHHIFPRLLLLAFVLASPRELDRLSVDAWLASRTTRRPGRLGFGADAD